MKNHAMPLVKIETDVGVQGIAACHHDVTGLGAKDVVLNTFRPMLICQDPFDIERLTRQMMFRISYLSGNRGIAVHAVTGVETALWDLTGKLLGMPVRKILAGGAYTNQVRAYWTSNPRTCSTRFRAANGLLHRASAEVDCRQALHRLAAPGRFGPEPPDDARGVEDQCHGVHKRP
jgi:L-alanine-DL-glutamate epimerase-like enolase superfamily enzyme